MLEEGMRFYSRLYCRPRATTAAMEKGVKLGTPGHSLALKYEVELQEQEGGGAHKEPSLSRVNKCFEILDEVIPHLGVYQRVMQLVRRELHVAVYSNDWTSKPKQQGCTEGGDPRLTPLPYFVIADRLTERKAGERSKLKSEISSLKEQLYTCEADLEKAMSSLDSYRHDIKDRESKLQYLTAEVRTNAVEREHLQEIIGHHQHSKERLCQEFDFRLYSLRNAMASLKEETAVLQEYKVVHDQLQGSHLLRTANLTSATSKEEIEQHVATTEKLKWQLLSLQNALMDELDSWLQSCFRMDSQIPPAEVANRKKKFKQKIVSLSAELRLLDQHQQTLSKRQQEVGNAKTSSPHTALILPLHPHNPLIPQEQLTNKYAAMIYTSSDGGKSFYPLKAAHHCPSCNQKTVLCPHKVCEDDLVIQLPVHVSHLKISRPSFQLVKLKPHTTQPGTCKVTANAPTSQGLHIAVPAFGRLWEKFDSKFKDFSLTVHRKIPQVLLFELVEQFYATLLLQDDRTVGVGKTPDTDDEDDAPTNLLDSLFEFMSHHYVVRTLAPICCHGFISSLEEFYSEHKELLLLSHALCGNLDGCAIRYSLQQASLVQAVNWVSHSQVPVFLKTLYPFLEEEVREQLSLNYVAHSDNRLSAQLVLDFLQFILLAHKDPLVTMLEEQLMEQPCHVLGCMAEAEFADAMEKIAPGNLDLLSHRLFLQSLLAQESSNSIKQTLPTKKLAYIAAYLYRSGTLEKLKQTELKAIQCSVDQSREEESKGYHRPHSIEESKGHHRPSIDTVRKLAQKMKTSNIV